MQRAFQDTNNHPSVQLLHGDCIRLLRTLKANSVDLVCTDPPYGIGFRGQEWDTFRPGYIARKKATKQYFASNADVAGKYSFAPDAAKRFGAFIEQTGRECWRVLKPGAFLFLTMTPRQDSLARVIVGLEDAGFKVSFTSLYWTFSSGFPKAMNIESLLRRKNAKLPAQARALAQAYAGFQPKPAVEAIVVAMKPLSEKNYIEQALHDGKGVTWLDATRIPGDPVLIHDAPKGTFAGGAPRKSLRNYRTENRGRFPANLLVSGDALGAYSRYFSLDSWAEKTLPFLIVPKASRREKDHGLLPTRRARGSRAKPSANPAPGNDHPTVKPLALMAYLIALGSRPGDLVLDPFLGSGTTALAAALLGRRFVGMEKEDRYVALARRRLAACRHDRPARLPA